MVFVAIGTFLSPQKVHKTRYTPSKITPSDSPKSNSISFVLLSPPRNLVHFLKSSGAVCEPSQAVPIVRF